ncbi:MAG: bifunctional UDP-N-acetylmuramoyl-tripeptide:D-alanyl-D-alanine ligase/alanine racemase [Flavitalea sp.]
MNYTIHDIAGIIEAEFLSEGQNDSVNHLLLDSRKLVFPQDSIFFALKSAQRNAVSFIPELYNQGVRNFVVAETINASQFPGASILLVKDVLTALQLLVAFHRNQFHYPVIGITGSNGKTIIKEWLHQLLMDLYVVVRSPRSYNSQIGVPLSVWQMDSHHQVAIFEAGISREGEMISLKEVIKPTIGIFTNIGSAHDEGFSDRKSKVKEKLELFSEVETLIYCADHLEIHHQVQAGFDNSRIFNWSMSQPATLQVIKLVSEGAFTNVTALYHGKEISISIPFHDKAYIENALHCWCVLLLLGVDADAIKNLSPVAMRLELKKGMNNISIINDSYSADLSSLKIALDFLAQQQQYLKRTVVLTDILESGIAPAELYKKVAGSLVKRKVSRLIGIGLHISLHEELFRDAGIEECRFFASVDDLKEQLSHLQFHQEVILFKGARKFGLEKIVHLLEEKVHQTVMEINLNSLLQNLSSYQKLLAPGTKVMAMVKAFSYGSGSFEIANALQYHKIDYLAVAYSDEGIDLRKGGIRLPIMVMNADVSGFESLVEHNLEPDIYSILFLKEFNHFLNQEGITEFPVHIELETGMNRLGFTEDDETELLSILKNGNFVVKTIFTHLVGSENPLEDEFTIFQSQNFLRRVQHLEQSLGYSVIKHVANSSGINRHKHMHFDMVRLGIGLYGVDSSNDPNLHLTEVSTLKSTIAQIKHIEENETVGYNRKGKVQRKSIIATVRIGYADGYPRTLSNGKGFMLIGGKPAPVIGTICMDMTMVDITDLPGIKEGDDVIVFGPALSVKQVALSAGTVPYEILTGISQRVKRVYYQE